MMCKKDKLYEELTESLYKKILVDDKDRDALYYLLNPKNAGILDKSKYTMEKYKEQYNLGNDFKIYKEKEDIEPKNNSDKCNLVNQELNIIIAGEVLNSFATIFKKYLQETNSISGQFYINYGETFKGLNGDLSNIKIIFKDNEPTPEYLDINNLTKLYFHSTTTIGNVMPWVKYLNPSLGNLLDIMQNKVKIYNSFIGWFKIMGNFHESKLLDDFLIQDFANKSNKEALVFFDETIKKCDIKWNLYFYRASKAIMKRSYRILTRKDPNAETEFTNAFTNFCLKYGIKNEIEELIGHLSKYEDQKIKGDKFLKIEGEKIDDELQELKKLKEILQRKSEELAN